MPRQKAMILVDGVADGSARQAPGGVRFLAREVDGPGDVSERVTEVRISRTELADLLGTLPAMELHEDLVRAYLALSKYLRASS